MSELKTRIHDYSTRAKEGVKKYWKYAAFGATAVVLGLAVAKGVQAREFQRLHPLTEQNQGQQKTKAAVETETYDHINWRYILKETKRLESACESDSIISVDTIRWAYAFDDSIPSDSLPDGGPWRSLENADTFNVAPFGKFYLTRSFYDQFNFIPDSTIISLDSARCGPGIAMITMYNHDITGYFRFVYGDSAQVDSILHYPSWRNLAGNARQGWTMAGAIGDVVWDSCASGTAGAVHGGRGWGYNIAASYTSEVDVPYPLGEFLSGIIETEPCTTRATTAWIYTSQGYTLPYTALGVNPGNNEPENKNPHAVEIYPNPAKNTITARVRDPGLLEVFDLLGKKVGEADLTAGLNVLDAAVLESGVYVYRCGEATGRIVIAK